MGVGWEKVGYWVEQCVGIGGKSNVYRIVRELWLTIINCIFKRVEMILMLLTQKKNDWIEEYFNDSDLIIS